MEDKPTKDHSRLTRRTLFKLSAAAAGGFTLAAGNALGPSGKALARSAFVVPVDDTSPAAGTASSDVTVSPSPNITANPGNAPSYTVSVLRREDMLALRFDFYNLALQPPYLVRKASNQPAYVVVQLAHGNDYEPQNLAEQAFLEADPNLDPNGGEPLKEPGTIGALPAGPSRLAFRVPDGVNQIPYTLGDLLAWVNFEQNVAAVAQPPPDGTAAAPQQGRAGSNQAPIQLPPPISVVPIIKEPTAQETALEAPWQLVLSPNRYAAWAHASTPVTRNGRTELWHTRLAVRAADPQTPGTFYVDEKATTNRTLRAIWTPGFNRTAGPPKPVGTSNLGPFRMSLSPNDRWQLVRLTSDYQISGYTPLPVQADRFMLSALGAWANTRGFWQPPKADLNLDITEWRNQAAMGRDEYVRVVYLGYLYPLGHPAALVKVTERKVGTVPQGPMAGSPAAYLRQRFFIVVRQPEKTYPADGFQPDGGRAWPFKKVRITTTVTPNLGDPADPAWDIAGKGQDAFWPHVTVNGSPQGFQFHLVAEDTDGQSVEFTAPLAFLSLARADDAAFLGQLNADYAAKAENQARRDRPLDGQKVAFAPSSKPGDTTVDVKVLTLGGTLPNPPNAALPSDHPRFYPTWAAATVRLAGAELVRGGPLPAPVVIQPHPAYVQSGFDKTVNPSTIFVKVKNAVPLSFSGGGSADKSGGVITPDLQIGGLSRQLGPFGGNVDQIPHSFDPASYFDDAKILGGILLKDILNAVSDFGDETKIPKLTNTVIYPNDDNTKPPQAIETRLSWKPELKMDEPEHVFDPTGATMSVEATFKTPIDPPAPPTYNIVGDMRKFTVNLIGDGDLKFLVLHFNKLTFTARTGKKPDIDVDISSVDFAGVLDFVNKLKDFLKSGKSGPSIEVTPTGVNANVSIGIPTIGVGVLTIQNISLSSGLNLPFTGKPVRARFAFCERESPFVLTFYGLGGGGFFGIAVGLDGVELLEASLEVGASLALDVGVASGEVHAMAGIYYKMEKVGNDDQASLTGYIRLGGSLDVLGLISVSLEFYLELKYEFAPKNELWGKATLTIEIHIIFFSISVDATVERRLAGGGGSSQAANVNGPMLIDEPSAVINNFADLVSQTDWNDYADAFATVPVS